MHRWSVTTTVKFDEWFAGLGDSAKGRAIQVELIAKVELLQVCGPSLGRPHADTLKGSRLANMKELRATTKDAEIRVAFAFDPSRAAILLCAGDKQGVGQKTFYKNLIRRAESLYKAHLNGIDLRKRKERK